MLQGCVVMLLAPQHCLAGGFFLIFSKCGLDVYRAVGLLS